MSKNKKNISIEPAETAEDEVITETAADEDVKPETKGKDEKKSEKPKRKNAFMRLFTSKKFKRGTLSIVFTCIFVAVIVLLNVIANMLLDRFDVKVDLTDEGLYSVEESTTAYISDIDSEVKIYVTDDETSFVGNGTYYTQTNEIIKKIVSFNKNFSVEYVNLLTNPSFAKDYTDLNTDNIIVESEKTGRYKVLTSDDFLDIKYYYNGEEIDYSTAYTYAQYGYSSYIETKINANAEQCIVSAVMSVTNSDPVRVAFTSGFGEVENNGFESLLDKNGYAVEDLDMSLQKDKIDSGIDFLVIYGPTSDYSNDALKLIDSWLDNEGVFNKNVIYMASSTNVDTPNIDEFLNDWGIKLGDGYIYQTNASYASQTAATFQMLQACDPENSTFNYTDGLDSSCYFLDEYIRPVEQVFEEYSNMGTIPLITSYDGAVVVPFDADADWKPDSATGVLNSAVEAYKVRFENTDPYYSRVIVFGSTVFNSEYYLSATQTNNAAYTVNMFNSISGKEEGVTLTSKSFSMTTFEIDAAVSQTLAIIFAIVLPILMIVAGIVVYVRRKHK